MTDEKTIRDGDDQSPARRAVRESAINRMLTRLHRREAPLRVSNPNAIGREIAALTRRIRDEVDPLPPAGSSEVPSEPDWVDIKRNAGRIATLADAFVAQEKTADLRRELGEGR